MALRWLETSATRPKRHAPPERRGFGHYHQAHLEILTVRRMGGRARIRSIINIHPLTRALHTYPARTRTRTQPEHARRQYEMVLGDMLAKDTEWLEDTPLFGATHASFQDHPLTCEQERATRRVLCVLGYTCEVDYCPLLLDLVPLLVAAVPEAVAYAVVRNMHLHRPFYFGTGHRHFLAVMAAFRVRTRTRPIHPIHGPASKRPPI